MPQCFIHFNVERQDELGDQVLSIKLLDLGTAHSGSDVLRQEQVTVFLDRVLELGVP